MISLQGLAPYRFETSAALFFDDDADLGLRLVAEREWWITQRLAFEGRTEFEAATDRDDRLGEVSGVQLLEFSLRLRFYIHREFAPYLGVSWETHREQGADGFRERETGAQFVGGVSVWF